MQKPLGHYTTLILMTLTGCNDDKSNELDSINNLNAINYTPSMQLQEQATIAMEKALKAPRSINRPDDYDVYGPYSYFDNYKKTYHNSPRITFDDDGIPMVKYGKENHYNAVTISQYALSAYSDYIKDQSNIDAKTTFLKSSEFLLGMHDSNSAYRYSFEWSNFNSKEKYAKGWVSAMAQGQVLSVFSRAYYLTKDEKYISSSKKVFEFTITPTTAGGTMTTLADIGDTYIDAKYKNNIFFEEYISDPGSYTLNGYMFTLLGLYDFSRIIEDNNITYDKNPKSYFTKGVQSLKVILPLYNMNGFSTYDLGHITYNNKGHIVPNYHAIHILLLGNIYSITQHEYFKSYQNLWTKYILDYKKQLTSND